MELIAPPNFDRGRLLEVLERRIHELEGRKSTINTGNRTAAQLNRDLNYILKSAHIRRPPEKPAFLGNFTQIAPSEKSERIRKLIKSYKVS